MKKLAVWLLAAVSAASVRGETVEVLPSQDITLYEAKPKSDAGASQSLTVGRVVGNRARTLIKYDVGAAVPAGSTITGATMHLTVPDGTMAEPAPSLVIHRIMPMWNEGSGEASLTSAVADEATWNHRVYPNIRWTRPGGAPGIDFARRGSAAGELSGNTITFASTGALVRDVQSWLDLPHTNEGWIVLMRDDSPAGETFFSSRETAVGPSLTIDFKPATADSDSSSATYEVTFHATWTAATHPREFPGSAHWSGLVGGLHNHSVSFWTRGLTSSEGIRRMAEVGAQSTLLSEVNEAIVAGTANRPLSGPGIGAGRGDAKIQFTVDRTHPLVTLTSMVAPSPDWFVGVRNLPLIERGRWVRYKSVPLFPYDTGTDSGPTFNSPNQVTEPRGVITRIVTPPLASPRGYIRPMGKMIFRRLDGEAQKSGGR